MELPEQRARGQISESLLENELLKEALQAIKDDVTRQWMECPARDHEGKEALWQLMKTAQKFENVLIGYIETGKLASEQLKRFEEKKTLAQRFKLA